MKFSSEVRLNKILKYGGACLATLLMLGVFAWRLDVAQSRANAAEAELAALKAVMGNAKPTPASKAPQVNIDPDAVTKKMLVGRWVNSGVFDGRDCTRTLEFEQHGTGHFRITYSNGETDSSQSGLWNVRGDVCFIEVKAKDIETYYLRIVRLTSEKLSVRNHLGIERVYDRVK
jgi:hypothetical protein